MFQGADRVTTNDKGEHNFAGMVSLDQGLAGPLLRVFVSRREELTYTGPDNRLHCPVMIHRAPFGSMERFVGVLIEHFAGAFPLWLAPEQVRVLPVSQKFEQYGRGVEREILR